MTVPEVYQVTAPISGINTVPITDIGASRFYRPCVRIILNDLAAGDVVTATGMIQVTQEKYYRVMTCRFLKVTDTTSWLPTKTDTPYSRMLSQACGTNVDRTIHHLVHNVAGSWVCPGPSPTGSYQFAIVSYAVRIEDGWTSGDALDLDYGELALTVHRASPA